MHLNEDHRFAGDEDALGREWLDEEGGKEEEDEFSIFNIEIAQILWRRKRENSHEDEYLIKYKARSYLHTAWLTELEINNLGKNMKNKINRFNKAHS